MPELLETLQGVQEKINHYRERRLRLTESDTIRVLIIPVLQTLGWDTGDIEEVRSEYRHASSDNPVDYALFIQGEPVLFVEAKALDVSLDERRHLVQTLNYANTSGVDWCVLTNGADWRIYKVHEPVEAERKLFLSLTLNQSAEELRRQAERLRLLSREHMGQRAMDTLWAEHRVDRQVEAVLDGLTSDSGFVDFIVARTSGLTHEEVTSSLRRARLQSSYLPHGVIYEGHTSVTPPAQDPIDMSEAQPPFSSSSRGELMRTAEMVERGLLPIGTVLTIKGSPNSEAKVISPKLVEYQREQMTFLKWGMKVKGWTAIQIYKWAVLPNGELLESLRRV